MPKVIPLKNLTKKTLYYISCLSALKKLTLYLRFYFSLLLSLSLSFWYWKKRTEKYLKLFVLLKLWYPFIRIILFNRFELQDTLLYSYTTTDFILYITFGSTIFNETWMNYYVVVVICVCYNEDKLKCICYFTDVDGGWNFRRNVTCLESYARGWWL